MRYEVTYQVAGEQQTDLIEAADAPSAADAVRQAHADSDGLFELILVHLVDEPSTGIADAATIDDEAGVVAN